MSDPLNQEIVETVARMERNLRNTDNALVHELMDIYELLVPRFEKDCDNERDRFFSRGGALMLIQEIKLGRNIRK